MYMPQPHARRHLRDLMIDERRCMPLIKESEGIYFDFTRQRVTTETMEVRMAAACCTAMQCLGGRRSLVHGIMRAARTCCAP